MRSEASICCLDISDSEYTTLELDVMIHMFTIVNDVWF